jgi:hypothetical protein
LGNLTYLIILLVVINIVGRILKALSASKQQAPPQARPGAKPAKPRPAGPFESLDSKLEELSRLMEEGTRGEKPGIPYDEPGAEPERTAVESPPPLKPGAEMKPAETMVDFERETAATREAAFERKPRPELHEESFPWQETKYGYKPPVSPVTPVSGPELFAPRSYRSDVVSMLSDRESVRNAVLLGTILGPCRAREGRYRFRGPR